MKKMKRGSKSGAAIASDIANSLTKGQIAPTDGDKPPEVRAPRPLRVEVIQIRHDFSQKELLDLGQRMADEARVSEAIESEAKACARQYKDKLTTSKTRITTLVDNIKEGFEMVGVEAVAMVRIDRAKNEVWKCLYRRDTGAFVRRELVVKAELDLFSELPAEHSYDAPLPENLLNSQV